MLKSTILIILALCANIYAVDTCSRLAVINYQEVLVDTNSTEKGEGLRFHLEKDPLAKSYLETYQEGTQIRWQNAVMGTLGTSLVLGGILTNNSGKKKTMLIGGATAIIINFLMAKTLDNANESNLIKAIEEYNKRNLPKIYFNPDLDSSRSTSPGVTMGLEKSWSF